MTEAGIDEEPWSETIGKLRRVKTDEEIEVNLCASQLTINKWASGRSRPRPAARRGLRKMIAEWLNAEWLNEEPTPVSGTDEVEVTQADIDMANDYLSSAFRCTATLAERFARHRIQSLSTRTEELVKASPEVVERAVEAALHARVPGGSEAWVWLPQRDAFTPSETARDVMRAAVTAALASHRGEGS